MVVHGRRSAGRHESAGAHRSCVRVRVWVRVRVRVHLAVVDVVRHGRHAQIRSGRRRETGEAGGGGGCGRGRFVQRSHHVLESQAALLLLRLGRQFAVAGLDAFLLHRQRSIHLHNRKESLIIISSKSFAFSYSIIHIDIFQIFRIEPVEASAVREKQKQKQT